MNAPVEWKTQERTSSPDYHGETYYGEPAIKPSPWDWKVAAYLFTSALSGGTQLIAAIADRAARASMRPVVRNARYIAALGAAAGPALLVRDLKTPSRWYNMLRIFRSTSPMSIGSFSLSAFGLFTVATALEEWLKSGSGNTARAQLPAAAAAVGMMTYTAPLLSSTSTPLWAAAPELLAARYGSSAVALAAASLSLLEQIAGRTASARKLDALALIATAANALFSRAAEQRYASTGIKRVLDEPKHAIPHQAAKALAIGVPLVCGVLGIVFRSRARELSIVGSVGIIAGTALSRWSDVSAGNASAERADVYLRFAQPHGQTHERTP